ncbi:hypothetical protein [Ktedonobacter robiniae]|uniref:Uncharacterized protein n=1 Tax=Ktedonobacter robiniae TaxID=2778365 RepID=A0ABQ3UYN9_9CHLR|nr:hypothetical protein [Ktedonobacter robiniae]GHO57783.1 hypothetical protein KSB_62580 [Ktedonobacter robiniae]
MFQFNVKSRISFTLNVLAEYHQFYLQDEQTETDTPDDWGEQLATQMIAVDPGIIGIATARNMRVPLRVDLFDVRPNGDIDLWDHVTEASLDVPSGQIVIAGSMDYIPDAKRLSVAPGSYRVRVYYGGLDTLSEDGLEGEDQYYVVIWPEKNSAPEILKKWSSL